jgi:hypothetical protein
MPAASDFFSYFLCEIQFFSFVSCFSLLVYFKAFLNSRRPLAPQPINRAAAFQESSFQRVKVLPFTRRRACNFWETARMSYKLASVPDRPDAAPCSEEGLVAVDVPAASTAAQPTVHIVAVVGGETHEFDVPADRTVEFVKAYLDNKHGCFDHPVHCRHTVHLTCLVSHFLPTCTYSRQGALRQANVALERSCAD